MVESENVSDNASANATRQTKLQVHHHHHHHHHSNSGKMSDEKEIQYKIHKYQVQLYKQSSIKSTKHVVQNDLHTKINRMYSKLLVDHHWIFLLIGVLISLTLSGLSLLKQPLPNFLDPKRGFGARGEGTLTSQLIVLKNINTELEKNQKNILKMYESKKKNSKSNLFGNEFLNDDFFNSNNSQYAGDTFYDDEDNRNNNTANTMNESEDQVNNNNNNNLEEQEANQEEEEEKIEEKTVRRESSLKNSEMIQDAINFESDRDKIWKTFRQEDVEKMMPQNFLLFDNQTHVLNDLLDCKYTHQLDSNLELYFSSYENMNSKLFFQRFFSNNSDAKSAESDNDQNEQIKFSTLTPRIKQTEANLLNLKKIKSLCEFDRKFLDLVGKEIQSTQVQKCYLSLPKIIAALNNKPDCLAIDYSDLNNFLNVVNKCYDLHANGILYAIASESKPKEPIFQLLDKHSARTVFAQRDDVKNNICFKKNLLHLIFDHLIDKEFVRNYSLDKDNHEFEIKVSTLILFNTEVSSDESSKNGNANNDDKRLYKEQQVYEIYLNNFYSKNYHDEETQVLGINLMGIRQETAMRLLSQEMALVAVAIILIVIVTLLYLKSIFISMIVNIGVGMSVGCSFFAYRIVFDIDLFPFINMMACFLLIGIACDNVYVLFDAWYTEKTKIILEDLSEMIEKYYPRESKPSENLAKKHDDEKPRTGKMNVIDSDESIVETKNELLLPPIFIKRRTTLSKKPISEINRTGQKSHSPSSASSSTSNVDPEQESFLSPEEEKAAHAIRDELLEKGIDISDYELNPLYIRLAPLTDEQMVRVMGGTLRHAASSIFVTSFTTAAAFFSNFITKLPYVQLFGVFSGFCILIYFIMVITLVTAFVITYEKYIQSFTCKFRPVFTLRLENCFENAMNRIAILKHRIISKHLPYVLIKFRVFWFTLFFVLGIVGMLVVFYKPQLRPPQNWRFQFFEGENLFEIFEFNIKDQFLSYYNEDKNNITNPDIFFIFGVYGKDTGRLFNPDDDGHLIYDSAFDFSSRESQIWINTFVTKSMSSRRDLFLIDELAYEWRNYFVRLQTMCQEIMNVPVNEIDVPHIPYEPQALENCSSEVATFLQDLDVENFETSVGEFPRRIVFLSNQTKVNGIMLRVRANRTFTDYNTIREYYHELKDFHAQNMLNASKSYKNGWFISIGFALYDLQYQLITGTYSSLVASMLIALIILLLTSGNIFISLFAILTITFSIADTIAIFVFMGWELSFLESVIIIMSVGLSVDFSCHYGVAYINSDREFNYDNALCCCRKSGSAEFDSNVVVELSETPRNGTSNQARSACNCCQTLYKRCETNNKERNLRIHDIFDRVGSAVIMAAFTTFLAGLSMYPSRITSFTKMGQFLMLVMFLSYLFATFFFVPMCALFGPTHDFGNLRLKEWMLFFVGLFRRKIKSKSNNKNKANNPS